MSTRKRNLAIALAAVVFACIAVPTATARPLDDFLCYKAKDTVTPPQVPPDTTLADPLFEAGDIPFRIKKAKEFCAPASKTGPSLIDPVIHLKRYRVKRDDGLKHQRQTVTVTDQFTSMVPGGPLVLETKKARDLMVPTTKSVCVAGSPENVGEACRRQRDCGGDDFCKGDPDNQKCAGSSPINPTEPCTTQEDCGGITYCPFPVAPDPMDHDVDHFKCYKVKVDKSQGPAFPKDIVTPVYDQFDDTGARAVPIKKPFELCNPVSKNGEGIKDGNRRLLCYKVKPVTDQRQANVANQFGIEQLDLGKEKLLCVPATASPSGAFLSVRASLLD